MPRSAPTASSRPFHVLAKPIGPICNLDCAYCFYLDKEQLFPKTPSFRMSDDVLEAFTRQYIEAHPPGTPEINFAWQGGEPTLMGIDFFRRALDCQQRFARPDLKIRNSIQTNGTLLNDDWGTFLAENDFLVGLSIDGPREMHDGYRVDKKGQPTFDQVMRGLDVLKRHHVDFNTLTVLNAVNSPHPREVYDFLTSIGSTFMQFIPLVEPDGSGGIHSRSVDSIEYGRFLAGVFDRWLETDAVGNVFIQDFDITLSLVMGLPSPVCTHAETCGRAVAIEHNGNLYSCDHFVNPEDQLGNVLESTLAGMLESDQQRSFGKTKSDSLPRYCRECEFLKLCWGGCPKDRLIDTPDGEPGLNYLCAGIKHFLGHSVTTFEAMARCLRLGQPASEWRQAESLGRLALQRAESMRPGNISRNDPCPCGSGLKYKRCCGR